MLSLWLTGTSPEKALALIAAGFCNLRTIAANSGQHLVIAIFIPEV
jgi:hypothetical protein